MRVNKKDLITLKIIYEDISLLRNRPSSLDPVLELLKLLLGGKVVDEGSLLSFLNQYIRSPLYNVYCSTQSDRLNNIDKHKVFTALMLLSVFWPINENCCITNTPEIVDEYNRVYFLSGHVADDKACWDYIERNPDLKHPVLDETICHSEVMYFYSDKYKESLVSSHYKKAFQDFINSSVSILMLLGTYTFVTLAIVFVMGVLTAAITTVFPVLLPVLLGVDSVFPLLTMISSACAGLYATYKIQNGMSENITAMHVLQTQEVFKEYYLALNEVTHSMLKITNTLRIQADPNVSQSIPSDTRLDLVKPSHTAEPTATPTPHQPTGGRSPLRANSLLRSSVSNDTKLEQEETAQAREGLRIN
jgi:hypothetical protein